MQAIGVEDHPCAHPQQNDADVFHTVKGEQALQVMFHQGIHDTQERRHRAGDQQREAPPPGEFPAHEIEVHPDQPVDGRLDHDP